MNLGINIIVWEVSISTGLRIKIENKSCIPILHIYKFIYSTSFALVYTYQNM